MLDLSTLAARSSTANGLFVGLSAEKGRRRLTLGALLARVSFVLGEHDLGARRKLVGTVVHPACATRVAVVAAVAALFVGSGGVVRGLVTAVLGSHPVDLFDEGAVVGALLRQVLVQSLLAENSLWRWNEEAVN